MTTNLPKEALALYEAPFRYEPIYQHVLDYKDRSILVLSDYDTPLGHHIAQALTEYWERNKP